MESEEQFCKDCKIHEGGSATCKNMCCYHHPKYLDPETINEKLEEAMEFCK